MEVGRIFQVRQISHDTGTSLAAVRQYLFLHFQCSRPVGSLEHSRRWRTGIYRSANYARWCVSLVSGTFVGQSSLAWPWNDINDTFLTPPASARFMPPPLSDRYCRTCGGVCVDVASYMKLINYISPITRCPQNSAELWSKKWVHLK